MNVLDIYCREFIKICANKHFFFFDQEDRMKVCRLLGIDNRRLDEIIQHAIDREYCVFFDPFLPDYVCPTNSGLRALGLESEVAA